MLIVAPEIQLGKSVLQVIYCPKCNVLGSLKHYAWSDSYRYVHGVSSGLYILQKRYKCLHCTKTISALDFIAKQSIPTFIRAPYSLCWASGAEFEETIFTDELARLIITDGLTAKTFDEIGHTVRQHHFAEYIKKRTVYWSVIEHKLKLEANKVRLLGVSSETSQREFDPFSPFEHKDGYNEVAQPDTDNITRFFIKFVEDNKQVVDACLDNIPPHAVISFDGTFFIQKQTKVSLFYYILQLLRMLLMVF